MAFTVKAKITGLGDLLAVLEQMKQGARNAILKSACRAAASIVLKAARAKVPVDTGWLKRSLGIKVGVTRSGKTAYAVVGPRKTETKDRKTGTRGLTAFGKKIVASGTTRRPAHYAHLVELGTVHSAPKPFLRPALESNRSAIRGVMREKIWAGLMRHRAKQASRRAA